ncbi:MAG: peptidase dimerization domain-containing protein [Anaerolineales bacterium]|nr:peptidase dimerization domain-containing protein [Anaerolineales bacterium]
MNPLAHYTINPKSLKRRNSVNTVPTEIEVNLDMRLVPWFPPEGAIDELRDLTRVDA